MLNKVEIVVCLIVLAIILGIVGCQTRTDKEIEGWLEKPVFATLDEMQVYVDSINGVRYYKDEWMRYNPNSPLLPEHRELFESLNYYPVDPSLVFRTRLHVYKNPDYIIMATTTGEDREAIRYGYFEVVIEEQPVRLHAYKFTRHIGTDLESYLFIPFRDVTSGIETYEAGRYIDAQEEIPGVMLIDFNEAYNPYCVYNERYSCPLPPLENHIDVAIRAGEKKFLLVIS